MDREAFIEFYSDFSDEDPEYIHEYLAAEGIDIDRIQAGLLEMVGKREAGLELVEERGSKSSYELPGRRTSDLEGDVIDGGGVHTATPCGKTESANGNEGKHNPGEAGKPG